MSRLLWVGVGAAGGIYAYRKGQKAWDTAKSRGLSGNATVVTAAASALLAQMRAEAGSAAPQPRPALAPAPDGLPRRVRPQSGRIARGLAAARAPDTMA